MVSLVEHDRWESFKTLRAHVKMWENFISTSCKTEVRRACCYLSNV